MKETEEQFSFEINYLALQILTFLKSHEFSPNGMYAKTVLVRKPNGKTINLKTAFLKVRSNVNYVDDELLEEINLSPHIYTKLKKDCNNK